MASREARVDELLSREIGLDWAIAVNLSESEKQRIEEVYRFCYESSSEDDEQDDEHHKCVQGDVNEEDTEDDFASFKEENEEYIRRRWPATPDTNDNDCETYLKAVESMFFLFFMFETDP